MKTKKKSGKTHRNQKSGKSQGKIREFDGIKKVGTLSQGTLNRLEKSGKITQKNGKLRNFQEILFDILVIFK